MNIEEIARHLEPAVFPSSIEDQRLYESAAIVSAAISLKRIADSLDSISYRLTEMDYNLTHSPPEKPR